MSGRGGPVGEGGRDLPMNTDSPIQRRVSHWGTGRHRDTGRLGDPVYRARGRGPAAPRPGPWSHATTLRAPSRELFRIYTEEDYLNGVGDGRVHVIGRPARRRARSRALLAAAAAFLLAAAVARQLALSAGNRRTTHGPFRLSAVSFVIAGLRLDTSHGGTGVGPNRSEDGPRWRLFGRIPGWANWAVRHPPGL